MNPELPKDSGVVPDSLGLQPPESPATPLAPSAFVHFSQQIGFAWPIGETPPIQLSPENTEKLLRLWQQESLQRRRMEDREMTLHEERTRAAIEDERRLVMATIEQTNIRIAAHNHDEDRKYRERMIARLIGSGILIGAMFLGAWMIDRNHDSAGVSFTLGVVAVIAAAYILGRHWAPTASSHTNEAEVVREPKGPE